jgi:hypothetical protein
MNLHGQPGIPDLVCTDHTLRRSARDAFQRRVCLVSQLSKVMIISTTMLFMAASSFAGSPECTCDPTAQTATLRQRLDSLRSLRGRVSLSFTGLGTAYAAYHPEPVLRLRDCTFDVANEVSGLVNILLGAKLAVGYPAGWESYQPEARFEVIFDVDQPDEIDLWFSNPTTGAVFAVGQSYDHGTATAYKIRAAGALRMELWNWVHEHGYPRQDTAAKCLEIAKSDEASGLSASKR